ATESDASLDEIANGAPLAGRARLVQPGTSLLPCGRPGGRNQRYRTRSKASDCKLIRGSHPRSARGDARAADGSEYRGEAASAGQTGHAAGIAPDLPARPDNV